MHHCIKVKKTFTQINTCVFPHCLQTLMLVSIRSRMVCNTPPPPPLFQLIAPLSLIMFHPFSHLHPSSLLFPIKAVPVLFSHFF
jgi:hypothetical protein